jgi:hypothetical protein
MAEPINFCPASASADVVARLEAYRDLAGSLRSEAEALCPEAPLALRLQMETMSEDLGMEADAARDRLAELDAVSPAGAIAQLLAAIHDLRVDDDAERERARRLEARALGYLLRSGLLDFEAARRLSRTAVPAQVEKRAAS